MPNDDLVVRQFVRVLFEVLVRAEEFWRTVQYSLKRLISMFSTNLKSFLKQCSCGLFVGLLTVTLAAQLQAQGTIDDLNGLLGGGGDGGGGDGGAIDGGGVGGGGADGGGDGGVNLEGAAELDFGGAPDMRNQGFVGATAPGITENGFVGAGSQTFGELAEGATFGGGVNDGNASSIPSGSGGGGGAGGFNGANAGGSVIRSNLRTRLRPAFTAPTIPSRVIEGNFNSNLARQPTAQSLVGRYQVRIENKTAIVTGVVNTQADADRLIRQLRLQPGVYGIVSQLQVAR